MPSKKELQQEIEDLKVDYALLEADYKDLFNIKVQAPPVIVRKETSLLQPLKNWWKRTPTHAADISLDLWPIQDWFRISYSPYSKAKYGQLCVGPLRMEFFSV